MHTQNFTRVLKIEKLLFRSLSTYLPWANNNDDDDDDGKQKYEKKTEREKKSVLYETDVGRLNAVCVCLSLSLAFFIFFSLNIFQLHCHAYTHTHIFDCWWCCRHCMHCAVFSYWNVWFNISIRLLRHLLCVMRLPLRY
jgi:predicted membrane protein